MIGLCAPGFTLLNPPNICTYIETTKRLNFTAAEEACKSLTSYQGGLAEARDNYTRDYIWANASMNSSGIKS